MTRASLPAMWMASLLAIGVALAIGIAAMPARADDFRLGIHIGTPAPPPIIVAPAPPPVVVAPPPAVVVAPPPVIVASPEPLYFYGGRYFVYRGGTWFVAYRHEGPWAYLAAAQVPRPVLYLPRTYERMPPGHARSAGPPPWAHGHGRGGDRD